MYPILLEIFGRPLRSWPVLAVVGLWAGYFSIQADLKSKNISETQIWILSIGSFISLVGGGLLGQFLTVESPNFRWNGELQFSGFVLYGGVTFVIFYGAILWSLLGWKKKIHLFELWDHGTLALLWFFAFVRLGCTLSGCCYGSPAGNWPGYLLNEKHWDFKSGPFPSELRGVKLHPALLYEAIGILGVIGVLYWIRRIQSQELKSLSILQWEGQVQLGVIGCVGWVLYGVLRFLLEFIRLDPRGDFHLGLSPSQWFALFTIFMGIYLIRRDPHKPWAFLEVFKGNR